MMSIRGTRMHRPTSTPVPAAAKAKAVVDALNSEIQSESHLVASLPAVLPMLKEAADKLLANTVIENYRVELL